MIDSIKYTKKIDELTAAISFVHLNLIQSVMRGQVQELPSCTYFHIHIEDDEDENLLQHLPAAVDFISSALASPSSAVLVHCAQGTSRSAAVALAYVMRTQDLDPDTALQKLKKNHPAAEPNSGFMTQLHLFHCMDFKLDSKYVPYRRFLAQQAAVQYQNTGSLDASMLSMPSVADSSKGAVLYRCRKCRTLLATTDNVLETETEGDGEGFAWRKRDKFPKQGGTADNDAGSGGIFVEPLRWMAGTVVDGQVQGKLYCPQSRCNGRLGTFNWSGIQNSNGNWVTPGIQLHLKSLDVEDPARQAALQAQLGLVVAANNNNTDKNSNNTTVNSPSASTAAGAATIPESGTNDAALATGVAAMNIRQPRFLPRTTAATTKPKVAAESTEQKFTHLILDCDGVMVDSERPSCEALRQAILQVESFDVPHSFPEDFQPVFGMDVRSCIEHYAARFATEHTWGTDIESTAARVSAAKEGLYEKLTADGVIAFSGVKELIKTARDLGMGVAVASSGSPEKIAHNLESSGLGGEVPLELIVSAKYVKRGKPAPDVYVEALRRLGCEDAGVAVVVEDAVNGLKAAKAAGCFTVAVTTSLPAELLAPFADVVVTRLEDIDFGTLR